MPPSVPKPKPATVWLTRDHDDEHGAVAIVKVWLQKPTRYRWTRGHYWRCDDESALWDCYTLADAERFYKTIPDDGAQLVRNGEV